MIELAGKRVVITGATGFIGRNVAQQLLEAGAQVYALVRPESKQKALLPAGKNMHILSGDLAHISDAVCPDAVRPDAVCPDAVCPDAVRGEDKGSCSFDLFLHFAWGGVNREEIDSPVVQKRNVDDSLACLHAAHALGCKVFMDAGSRVEYGITEDGTMEEHMECQPVNAYGKAKLEFYRQAEPLCRKWGMTYYHLRFFSVYGVGDHPWSIISTLTRDLPMGKKVSLSACMHRWNFMEIRDASRAVLELYRHADAFAGQTGIVNIASADTRRLREFVEEIHSLAGNRGELEYGTFVQAKEGALSICPETKELCRYTENTWKEQISFREGIRNLLSLEHQEASL